MRLKKATQASLTGSTSISFMRPCKSTSMIGMTSKIKWFKKQGMILSKVTSVGPTWSSITLLMEKNQNQEKKRTMEPTIEERII